jgi:hypothetical protein
MIKHIYNRLFKKYSDNTGPLNNYQAIRPKRRTGARIGAVPLVGAYSFDLDQYVSITPDMVLYFLFESKGRLFFEVSSNGDGDKLRAPDRSVIYLKKGRFLANIGNFKKL